MFLLAFLRARKFQLDRVMLVFVNYCKFMEEHMHIVEHETIESIIPLIRQVFLLLFFSASI